MRRNVALLCCVLLVGGLFIIVMGNDVSIAHQGQKHRYRLMQMAQDPNQTRTAAGLPMLTLDRQLTKEADHYASVMCRSGVLEHADDIMGNRKFWFYGENIGYSGEVDWFEDAFAESPGHYANIVEPRFTHYGVGVCRRGPVWYVVYRFGGHR